MAGSITNWGLIPTYQNYFSAAVPIDSSGGTQDVTESKTVQKKRRSMNMVHTREGEENYTEEPEFPLKPGKAIKTFNNILSDYEKGEILDYKSVWYVGENCEGKIKGSPLEEINNGYDDEKGDYLIRMNDHIGYRYEIIDRLGKGSFG